MWKVTITCIMCVCLEWLGSQLASFHDIFLRGKSAEKIQVSLKSDKNNGTLLEDRYTFIISRSILVRMRNISDESCRESQNTFYFQVTLFSQNFAIDEIMWENIVEPDRSQTTVCSVCIHKATNVLTRVREEHRCQQFCTAWGSSTADSTGVWLTGTVVKLRDRKLG